MRSVFVHFAGVTRSATEEILCAEFPPGRGPWVLEVRGDAVLHIDFDDDLEVEFADGEKAEIERVLGAPISVSVCADVSGRHPGDTEVREFLAAMMSGRTAIAQDDYTDHPWSLLEIQNGSEYEGHTFFDYNGRYEDSRRGDGDAS